jgi:predicted small lipoprotein YifL
MTPRRPRLFLLVPVAVLIAAATLAGCGNKGPLYLPDRQAENPTESQDRR